MSNIHDENVNSELVQGSILWKERRKRSVTASDISILMMLNPWCTPMQLFEQKLGYREVKENEAMAEGKRLEPFARAKLQDLFQVELNSPVCFHPQFDWQMASLDAIDDKGKFLTEIKCSKNYHDQARKGIIPDHVKPQLQWQMHVTGVDNMYYYAFYEGSGILIPVIRDNVFINRAVEKAKEFYKCLQTLQPPPLIEKDIVQREDHEFLQLAMEWQEVKKDLKKAQEQEEMLKQQLIALCGDSCAEGGGIKITRYPVKGRIDYSAISELQDLDLEKYRKPLTIAWRIT